jgi:hypothetical protein
VKSYERCLQGDFQHITILEEIYQNLQRHPLEDIAIQPQSQEAIEDDEDDESEMDVDETVDENPAQPNLNALASSSSNGPIIDEEGFQLVQTKGRRRGR